MTHIHWFRRDFRLTDNTALHAATLDRATVIPVYILSNWKRTHRWTGPGRQQFICGCLRSLTKDIHALGGRLIIRQGDSVEELRKLVKETKATAIYSNRDPDPFGRAMEKAVSEMAKAENCELKLFQDIAIHERDDVKTGSGTVFRVFTPYSHAWRRLPLPSPAGKPSKIHTRHHLFSEPLPTLETWGLENAADSLDLIDSGEDAARDRLHRFLNGPLFSYGTKRNLPAEAAGSRFSQDFRWGLLSVREVYSAVISAAESGDLSGRKSAEVFATELIWREFYMQILWHFPEVLDRSFNPKYDDVSWKEDKEADVNFSRWCAGETGFPIVDAAMRQLNKTGYMHNRLRMIVAMFLTKDLHIHWNRGERYFAQHLIDGEIANNNGGWQWSAGTGADAAPYFRIQNPWTQTVRFDPEGTFIKSWVPELRSVEKRRLMVSPDSSLALAKGYPLPMVDHDVERKITLQIFQKALK